MKEKISIAIKRVIANRRRFILFPALFAVLLFFVLPVSQQRLRPSANLRLYSSEGMLLRQFNPGDSGVTSSWVGMAGFPASVREAAIRAEDRRFYYHPGFDPVAVVRAAWQNIRSLKIVSGGSTITQQAARIVYADIMPGNILLRKILEIVFAVKLELHCSKDEILEIYLNRVPMKYNQRGLPAASVRIFGRDIRFISREESAALVVLMRQNQASRELFRARYARLMKETWGEEIKESAAVEEAVFRKGGYFYNDPGSSTAHFEVFLSSFAGEVFGDVRTSISANLNEAIGGIINNELKFIARYNVENCAVIVLRLPAKGGERTELVAMVGSENFYSENAGQVNGCLSIRSAGSTLKPLLYGLAMDTRGIAPWTIVNDVPFTVGIENGESYSPKNNDLSYWGPITVREALACSRNIPAVYMITRTGVNSFFSFLLNAGFTHMDRPPDFYGPGLALGAGGASLLELCRAYSAIACAGIMYPLYIGRDMYASEVIIGSETRLFSEKTAYRLTGILSDREVRRRAFGSRNFLDFPYDVAVKTGTSKDFRDAWTIGFTDKYVVGVWVGNFSGKMMNSVSGGWGAGRVFHQVIRLVTGRERPEFRYPDNYKLLRFCTVTGLPAGKYCRYSMELTDYSDRLQGECTICTMNDKGKGGLYSAGDEPEVFSPVNGETYIIDPQLPASHQEIPLRIITGRGMNSAYFYSIDGRGRIPLRQPVEKTVSLKTGNHTVEIYRGGEVIKTISFTVE